MSEAAPSFEGLLREALAPVEPPADLAERLESTLTSITEMAADELEAWELSAMRDPRNWARPAAALVGGVRGGADPAQQHPGLLRRLGRRAGDSGAHRRGHRARGAQAARRPLTRSRRHRRARVSAWIRQPSR
jgi:hypothetical protein